MPRINIPPLSRACLISCLTLSVLSGALRYRAWLAQHTSPGDTSQPPAHGGGSQLFTVPYLTVVPAQSLVYPWTFVTATLVEQNIFTLATTLGTLFYGGKYLERAWSSAEFAKFLLVLALVPNVVTFAVYIAWFAVTGNVMRSLTTICGGVAVQAGFLVAFKQLVPEHTVAIFKGLIKIRVRHFPALFLLGNTIAGPVFGTDVAAVLAWLGFLSSWTYLRFYKRSFPDLSTDQSPALKGDASETFALAHFFPEPIHRPVAVIADIIYNVLVAVKICTPFSSTDIAVGNTRAEARGDGSLNSLFAPGAAGRSAPSAQRAEAERRRALALKALDQRLHAATNKSTATVVAPTSSQGLNVLGETSLDIDDGHSAP